MNILTHGRECETDPLIILGFICAFVNKIAEEILEKVWPRPSRSPFPTCCPHSRTDGGGAT